MGGAPPPPGEPSGKKTLQRRRLRLRGLVQGVGFRPYAYALARRFGLSGFVFNDTEGVLLEAQGEAAALRAFEAALEAELPPLARLDALEAQALPCRPDEGFAILQSPEAAAAPLMSVGPDMAPCKACLEEMLAPAERRFLYPFLNCTHCGPRFTLCLDMPWDRPNTTLAGFPMCEACAAEYANPADRRFHAQPMACPACGPRLESFSSTLPASALPEARSSQNPRPRRAHVKGKPELLHPETQTPEGSFPLADAGEAALRRLVACISGGGIVALKAAGGFQLACDAHSEAAVRRLRRRKKRDGKPLAVMLPNLETARRYARLSPAEAALLQSGERPIVLVRKREEGGLAEALAPGLACLGLCLPSTPLHHALFYEALARPASPAWLQEAHALAWVMTSANLGGEPLAKDNDEALSRLSGVADAFALHNRPIALRMDDSVLQLAAGAPQLLRRARGFVPRPLPLPWRGPPLLAVGGHLKASFCLVHNNRAYVSQHLGDLDSPEARASFGENVEDMCRLLRLQPELLAADLHPDYFSSQWAEAAGLPCLRVQHHAAHVAAVWAEYPEVPGPLLGLALDGVGLGADGLPWGGELLLVEGGQGGPPLQEQPRASLYPQQAVSLPPQPPRGGEALFGYPPEESGFLLSPPGPGGGGFRWHRLGYLKPLPLYGGDAAAREPWRMGVAARLALGAEAEALAAGAPHGLTPALLAAWQRGGLKAPLCTSLGRFFDAAAHLLGLCEVAGFEAEAPMRLEALAQGLQNRGALLWPLEGFQVEAGNVLNLLGLLRPLLGLCHPREGTGSAPLAAAALWLHEAVAEALASWAAVEAGRRGLGYVALGGGCLQNRLLCEALVRRLGQRGLRPLLQRRLPPNDGGLCLGQALAATRHFS